MGNEQVRSLEEFSLIEVHLKAQRELEDWHSAALNHLGQIFSQRLTELDQIFNEDIRPNLEKYKQQMIEQMQKRIRPKIDKLFDEPSANSKKIQQIQVRDFFSGQSIVVPWKIDLVLRTKTISLV